MSVTALLLVLFAAVCHATWNIVAHGVSRIGVPFLWWGAVASSVIWLPVVPFTGGIGAATIPDFLLAVAVSTVLHCTYMLVLQKGYESGRLSTVYATARGTGPTITVLVAVLVLGERPSASALVGVAAIIASVVAIGLIDRPAATTHLTAGRRRLDPGIAWGLITGVAIAIYTIWDAHAVRELEVAPVAFMVGCTVGEILMLSPMLGRRWRELGTIARTHWRRLLAFGVLSPLSYILVLVAVTLAPVSLVAPVREVSVVLVSIFGALVLREGRAAWRVGASVVVVAGIVLMAS
ncbi:EamA family transporter [Agromyces cerinus]|uniref:Uncharacterized membrane protein n=1 Tax=Agromyces cerinus subsp. cerinus TaxID=232089 RepID=A0A1N6G591_9MICO|nr:EamA family transporter [Agromyces cerinus]SIO02709.1 Uncharacterized membrane protein [Agromyces cerinus subsp. cerinus]